MLTIRRETDYAIQILKLLAKNKKKFLSLSELAKQTGISFPFLQKIARKLRLAGLIKAEQGAKGGYALNLPTGKINLRKIIEALEGPCAILPCFCKNKKVNCVRKHSKCHLQRKLKKLNSRIVKAIEASKLKDL